MILENGYEGGKWQEKVGGVCLLPDSDGHPLRPAQGESKDTESSVKASRPTGRELSASS